MGAQQVASNRRTQAELPTWEKFSGKARRIYVIASQRYRPGYKQRAAPALQRGCEFWCLRRCRARLARYLVQSAPRFLRGFDPEYRSRFASRNTLAVRKSFGTTRTRAHRRK